MSYSNDQMQSLVYRIKDLCDKIDGIKYSGFIEEQKRANDLKQIELELMTGLISKEDAKNKLELMINSNSELKRFHK